MKKTVLMVAAAILLCGMMSSCSTSSRSMTDVTLQPDTTTVLRNPLNGWAMYLGRNWDENFWKTQHYDSMPTSEGTEVRVSDYASAAYIRTSWASLEPQEGVYTWRDTTSRIYRLFKSCTDRGLRLAFRIVVDGRDQGQNTPMYVIDAGAEYYTSGNGRHKSPYPDDPVFQEKYAKFIKALAEDFNDRDKVDFIDAFGLGKWGESHAMIYNNPANKIKTFDWITSLYSETFTEVPLIVHYHRLLADMNKDSWGPVSPDTDTLLQMAIDRGYSLRHDAFGMTGYYQDWEKEFAKKWNYRLPIIFEGGWITAAHHRYWIDPSGKYRQGHSEDVRRGEFEAAAETHVNMMDLRINDETKSWFGDCFDLVKRFVAEGGYRLYPDLVSVPAEVKSGETVKVSHRWNNLGWGYCPNNIKQWNYRYKVAFALLDAGGNVVTEYVDTESEPSEWIKGTPVSYDFRFRLDNVPAGEYTWAIGLVDTTKDNNIGLETAVSRDRVTPEGWCSVLPVTVK